MFIDARRKNLEYYNKKSLSLTDTAPGRNNNIFHNKKVTKYAVY